VAEAARGERISVAAVRLAFCEHPGTRRWLVHQEGLLLAARLRLGERAVPPSPPNRSHGGGSRGRGELGERGDSWGGPSTSTDKSGCAHAANQPSPLQPPPPLHGYRWVEFERAIALLSRRGVTLSRGWAAVPDALMCYVAVADQSAALTDELEAVARRLEHMRATVSAGTSPGLVPLLAQLAAWRPERRGYRTLPAWDGRRQGRTAIDVSRDGGGGGGGGGRGGGDVSVTAEEAGAGGWVTGQNREWRRGRRRNRLSGEGGGGAASSLPALGSATPHAGSALALALAAAAAPALGIQASLGRLPTGPLVTDIGGNLPPGCAQ